MSAASRSASFQSTPSGGKATHGCSVPHLPRRVSIHAFRGEGDAARRRQSVPARRFIPRLPGGRRLKTCSYSGSSASFNPRLPGGRRLAPNRAPYRNARCFNPRLPGGRRLRDLRPARCRIGFNPRLPGGRRPLLPERLTGIDVFQSTPSGGKATRFAAACRSATASFNPRLPGGRRPTSAVTTRSINSFNPRLPGGRRRESRAH